MYICQWFSQKMIITNRAPQKSRLHKWSRLNVLKLVRDQPGWLHTPETDRLLPLSSPPPAKYLINIYSQTEEKLDSFVLKFKDKVPCKFFLLRVRYEPPSTWLFRCVSCLHSIPWSLRLQSEEASASSEPLSGHHSSIRQCHKEQKGQLKSSTEY